MLNEQQSALQIAPLKLINIASIHISKWFNIASINSISITKVPEVSRRCRKGGGWNMWAIPGASIAVRECSER